MGTFQIQNRQLVDYVTLPKYVGQSVAAAEDKTFFENQASTSRAWPARSGTTSTRRRARDQGGSTLTQQYVERYFVDKTTTDYVGKAKEAILAVKVTRDKSKDEILEATSTPSTGGVVTRTASRRPRRPTSRSTPRT